MTGERVQRRLAAILAADVVGYSRLMEADEAGTLARLKALRLGVIDPAVARHSGRMVKLMGDGALLEFASAVEAVTCAMEIQKLVAEHDRDVPVDARIRFRIGINVGDVIVDGDDLYGDGVNVAARLETLAQPGGIYISRSAADQVRDKIPVGIESRGSQSVKNIARPIEVFCVVGGSAPHSTAASAAPAARHRPPMREKTSIAVLAFNNMSGDADQEYFSDGISEDIITDLAKLSDLHVIARNSSFAYKKSPVSLPEVAAALGVRYVLEGSVRKAGSKVRVTAQLIDATTGGHAWAERFDRELTDVFAVQDELTQHIVTALKVRLTTSERDRITDKPVADVTAHECFLRGREQVWLHTRAGNAEARAHMAEVLKIDPNCAVAYAYTSFALVNDYINGWATEPEQALLTGLELARHAIALDDQLPEGHFVLGVALLWNRQPDEALGSVLRCIALAPSSAEGLILKAHIEMFNGNPAKSIETLDAYMKLDPVYPEIALQFLAEAQFLLGRFDLAADTLRKRLERNPEATTAYALLASSLGHLGQIEAGKDAWAQVLRLEPNFSVERRRKLLPFKNPADFELRVEGLRHLGLAV
ncbi:TolB-like protein/class 3 adenylate cyclase/cytochrome c-type biogenesis protein CcmH/NrfG [Mycoplana sp. BE70]|uniref:adenylate/guanylate cyclase domain-containing protein n=1 Tax=Mycoplana sp. BE70 TaxID=2817775 RepID=UPI00285EFEBD|nr:adenylate/guanylate cyclase domain-containing protein [Mycoplana sp. BE70]MDR6758526.1 TolB-like protein/class 3 adenylate cyclase/cytochrome c-type biogenesis protein CcmH/NrfG [Mycoplana sp. BE70]